MNNMLKYVKKNMVKVVESLVVSRLNIDDFKKDTVLNTHSSISKIEELYKEKRDKNSKRKSISRVLKKHKY